MPTHASTVVRFRLCRGGFFAAPGAVAVGEVEIGAESSLWFGAVVRGDVAAVRIGKRVNIQDGVCIHCDSGVENVIEDDVTIGHGAIVHGAFVGRGSLIGMGARVLGRTRIGRGCLVAAGAVVPPGLDVPDGMLVIGVPGKIARPVKPDEVKYIQWLTEHYVQLARRYADEGFADRLA